MLPPELEQLPVEQPREADLVGEVLDLGRLPLAHGRVLGDLRQVALRRLVSLPDLPQQHAVRDQVGVAPDRRGEVAVARAREARVAEVARVVARLLEGAQDERRERLPPPPGRVGRTP